MNNKLWNLTKSRGLLICYYSNNGLKPEQHSNSYLRKLTSILSH